MELTRRNFIVGAGQLALGATAGSAALAACTSGGTGASTSASGPSAALTMWTDYPEGQKQVTGLVAQFQKQNPGITVTVTAKSGAGYQPAIAAALATGSAPDIFKADAGGSYQDVINGKHFQDLTGKLANISNLNDAAAASSVFSGKIYGAPILGQFNIGIYYWLDTFAKYKLQPPKTWADWTTICDTLLRHGVVPLMMPTSDGGLPTFLWTTLLTTVRGPTAVPKIETGQLKITEPDFRTATDYLYSLKKYFNPGYLSVGGDAGMSLFAFKKAAMIVGGSANYAGFQATNPAVTGNLGYFAVPAPPGQQPAVTIGLSGLYGVNTTLKDPAKTAAAIKFLDWWLTPAVGTQVSNTIQLSCIKDATTTNPMFKEIIAQSSNAGPCWFMPVPLTPVWNYAQSHIAKMFTGAVSTTAFNAAAQAQIKP